MKKTKKTPKVLLVGRTNVGKSTLFNRILGKTTSLVFDQEGVTRDYIEEDITWDNKQFSLVDTGGLSFGKNKPAQKEDVKALQPYVQQNVLEILQQANIILFVCDGKNGLTTEDLQVSKVLHKTNKPVLLLINKADNTNALQENLFEFNRLGFPTMIPVSAIHGSGINDVLDTVTELLTKNPQVTTEIAEPTYRIAIIGRPNVGKSSLMNLLAQHERSIVSDIPGTTREAISEKIVFENNVIQLTDTAGVRKKSRIDEPLENLMVKSSLSTIRQADLIILVVDASEGKITDQELKLLFYASQQHKPAIILFNKTDLLVDDAYKSLMLEQSKDEYEFVLKKFPQIATSCLTKKNVGKILTEIHKVLERCAQQFDPFELDTLIKDALQKKPLYHKRTLLKLCKIKQLPSKIPAFMLYVNFPEWFEETQLGFIENTLRKHYDLRGCPIRFSLQKV